MGVWAGPLEGGGREITSGESCSMAPDSCHSSCFVVGVTSPQYVAAGPLFVVGVGMPIVDKFRFSTIGRDKPNGYISRG